MIPPRCVPWLLVSVVATGCASPNLSVSPGEERLPLYRDNPSSGITALTPSLNGTHDRSHWSTVAIDIPMDEVRSPPNIDWEFFAALDTPRDRGEFPTVDSAITSAPVTGDHVLETVNVFTAWGSIILTPIVMWIPPPWDVQRNPGWTYEHVARQTAFDGSAWVSEPVEAPYTPPAPADGETP